MTSFYATLSIADLKQLKGKKMLRGMKISKSGAWFDIKERDTLRQQIRWINAELAAREAHLSLPL